MGLSRKKCGKDAPEMKDTPFVAVFLVLQIIFKVILPAAVSDLNQELNKLQKPDEEKD